jgi:hypothetical protein
VDRWVDTRKKKMKKTKGARSKKEIEEEITELRAEARKLIGRATDVEIISTPPPPATRATAHKLSCAVSTVSFVVCIVGVFVCHVRRQAPIRRQCVLLVAVPDLFSD